MRCALREVALLARDGDADGLRLCLPYLDPPLVLGPRADRSDMDFVVAVRLALRCQHEARAEVKSQAQRWRSEQAAVDLVSTSRWKKGRFYLDPALLLGPLLSDQRRKHVTFVLEEQKVSVRRAVLARAPVALRPMVDLVATLDPAGLHLRWHGGRGGLDLRPQDLSRDELRESLMVVFPARARRRPKRAGDGRVDAFSHASGPCAPPASDSPRERPSGAWLADALVELGIGL